MKILWKEWRQQRWFLLAGGLLGILLPVSTVVQALSRHQTTPISLSIGGGVILTFGGLFALILAVATTYDDVRRGVDDFWQSKPVNPRRVFRTKLLLGALGLLGCFLFAESLDWITHIKNYRQLPMFSWVALCYAWPLAVMIFSVTMCFTVLLRDATRAVLLSIWFALLVYFLPLLLRGLAWLNLFEQTQNIYNKTVLGIIFGHAESLPVEWTHRLRWAFARVDVQVFLGYLVFLAFTAAVTIAGLVLAVQADRRHWRWEPGQKTIVWLVGLSAAFIFGVSMFHVGSNLTPVTSYRGKPMVVTFNAPPARTIDWVDSPGARPMIQNPFPGDNKRTRLCIAGDLLFRAGPVQAPPRDWHRSESVQHDFCLDIYRHPGREDKGVHLSRVRFFSLPSAPIFSGQQVNACLTRGNRLYVIYQLFYSSEQAARTNVADLSTLRFLIVDITDPLRPRRVRDTQILGSQKYSELGSAGVGRCDHGDDVYIVLANRILIFSLADREELRQVRTVTPRDLELEFGQRFYPARGGWFIPSDRISLAGSRLLCSTQSRVLLLDLADPHKPRTVYYGVFDGGENSPSDVSIEAAACEDDLLYLSQRSGISIYRLKRAPDGRRTEELVGHPARTAGRPGPPGTLGGPGPTLRGRRRFRTPRVRRLRPDSSSAALPQRTGNVRQYDGHLGRSLLRRVPPLRL
jgi:hypothetical protein